MLKALDTAQELWANPAELIAQWEQDLGKVQEEDTIHGVLMDFEFPEGISIADVGCGCGRYAKVVKSLKPAKYTGFDLTPAMIDAAMADTDKPDYAEFTCVDAFNFSPDEKYDLLICIDVLIHQNDPLQALTRLLGNWDAKTYIFTMLLGKEHQQLYNSTVVALEALQQFADTWDLSFEHMHIVNNENFSWAVLSYERA